MYGISLLKIPTECACSFHVTCLNTPIRLYISRVKLFSSENVRLKRRVETLETENKLVRVLYLIFSDSSEGIQELDHILWLW